MKTQRKPTPVCQDGVTPQGTEPTYGFTKREEIAKDLLQGLLSSEECKWEDKDLVDRAWHLTNLLLKKFEEGV